MSRRCTICDHPARCETDAALMGNEAYRCCECQLGRLPKDSMEDEQKVGLGLLGEPELWYRRFREYLAQEPPRSLLAIYRATRERKGTKKNGRALSALVDCLPASWAEAKEKYHWRKRADAYDREETDRRIHLRARKQRAHEERELAGSQAMFDKALLTLPTVEEKEEGLDEDGMTKTVVMMPGDPKHFATAARLHAQASANGRLALGMPTQISVSDNNVRMQGGGKMLGVIILPDNHRGKTLEEALPFMEGEVVQHPPATVVVLPDRDPLPEE